MAETDPWHSVWRPLVEVVDDLPFAVCDARTGSSTDLLEVEFINSDYVRRSFMVKYSEKCRFYYLSRMKKNEVCVFKVFDSANVKSKCKSSMPLIITIRFHDCRIKQGALLLNFSV
jgi:hypothetical protein